MIASLFDLESAPHWYIVQTYVGFEDVVKRVLGQKIANLGLDKKIIDIYIPTKKVIKFNTKKQAVQKDEKVYPGYLYIYMYYTKETAFLIQNTQYVSKIAGTGDTVIPLEDGYVEELKSNLLKSEESGHKTLKINYILGDLVKVNDGPFQDMIGKISGIDTDNLRVNVLLNIFDRETDVELNVNEIEKVIH
jgi:transcription termination/antitermination protein NusG